MGNLRTERMPNDGISRSKKHMCGNSQGRGKMTRTAVVADKMGRFLQEQFSQIGIAYWLYEFDSFVKSEIGLVDFFFQFFIRLAKGKDDATLVIIGKPSLGMPQKNAQWDILFL